MATAAAGRVITLTQTAAVKLGQYFMAAAAAGRVITLTLRQLLLR